MPPGLDSLSLYARWDVITRSDRRIFSWYPGFSPKTDRRIAPICADQSEREKGGVERGAGPREKKRGGEKTTTCPCVLLAGAAPVNVCVTFFRYTHTFLHRFCHKTHNYGTCKMSRKTNGSQMQKIRLVIVSLVLLPTFHWMIEILHAGRWRCLTCRLHSWIHEAHLFCT